jgi:hypothetical protein
MLSIWTFPSILAVKNTKQQKKKKQNIPNFHVLKIFLFKKNVLEVEILYKSQKYKRHAMYKILRRGLN